MRFVAAAVAPFVLIGGLVLASDGGAASGATSAAKSTPNLTAGPLGTPTGCKTPGYLCSYFGTGSGQGASDICIEATGNVTNWSSHVVDGKNCHTFAGALVNDHGSGDVVLYSGTSGGGQEACISNGSYYDNLSTNYYPNGVELINNIDSSYQENGGVC
jgi:hypothetical protein